LSVLPAAQEHVLAQEDGKNRLCKAVTNCRRRSPWPCRTIRRWRSRRRGFFQAVGSVLTKSAPGESTKPGVEMEQAIRQIVSRAVVVGRGRRHLRRRRAEEAGHLDPVRRVPGRSAGMPQRNLAVEMLQKLINAARSRRGPKERRAGTLISRRCWRGAPSKYQNRAIETAQVIEELIALAKDMREASRAAKSWG
jgi:type I restriction enzyme, R subunit